MVLELPLIAAIVIGLGLAFVLGTAANRLRLPPLVGYLLAGVMVGPFTPGFIADRHLTLQLADIGVILLMFGVGLHFSLKDLLSVRAIVIPGAILQAVISVLLGTGASWLFGWPVLACVMFGLCLSVASTVVVMRTLEDRRATEGERGAIAMGWLVVQDLLTVFALVLLPAFAALASGGKPLTLAALAGTLGVTLGKLALFAALMFVVGRRVIPAILHYIAHTGSRELFRLAVLSVALGVAVAASALFGVSIALGAFFAGMILSESRLAQRAAQESLPLRDAFAVLFFVSVGMLFNPMTLLHQPGQLAITLFVVLAGNGLVTFGLVRLFGYPLGTALFIGTALAQIGEFSFILADLEIGLHLLPREALNLVLGSAILSILANPLLFAATRRLRKRFEPPMPGVPQPAEEEKLKPTTLTAHAVLVGYGRVGRLIGARLRQSGVPLLVIEESEGAKEPLEKAGVELLRGNAARAEVLAAANLGAARLLFVAIPEAFEAGQIVEQARAANRALRIVARAHFDAEVEHLYQLGANVVVMGEREIALAMLAEAEKTGAVSLQPA